MGLFLSNVFDEHELTNAGNWYPRVLQPVSNALTQRLGDQNWIAPTLGNSWVNAGAPNANAGYRIRDGVVWLRGVIKNGTQGLDVAAGIAFTLPTGYLTTNQLMFLCSAGGGFARVDIFPSGAVYIAAYGNSGGNTAVSLDGVCFPTGDVAGSPTPAVVPNIWPLTANPVQDGVAATTVAWWQGLFKPINSTLDGLDADDTGWISISSLGGSWVAFGAAGWMGVFYRRRRGIVHLQGLLKNGTSGSTIFTLPSGYRPLNRTLHSAVCDGPGAVGSGTEISKARVDVLPTGVVTVPSFDYSGNNAMLSLAGVRFYADGS